MLLIPKAFKEMNWNLVVCGEVRKCPIRGKPDSKVWEFCCSEHAVSRRSEWDMKIAEVDGVGGIHKLN